MKQLLEGAGSGAGAEGGAEDRPEFGLSGRRFLKVPVKSEHYHEFEVSKYKNISKRGTHV